MTVHDSDKILDKKKKKKKILDRQPRCSRDVWQDGKKVQLSTTSCSELSGYQCFIPLIF